MMQLSNQKAGILVAAALVFGCAGSGFERTKGVPQGDPVTIGWQSDPANRTALAQDKQTALVVSVVISNTTRSITLTQPQILIVDAPPDRSIDDDAIELVARSGSGDLVGVTHVPRRRYYVSEEHGIVEAESQTFVATLMLTGRPSEVTVRDGPPDLSADPLDVGETAARFCEDYPQNPVCLDPPVEP